MKSKKKAAQKKNSAHKSAASVAVAVAEPIAPPAAPIAAQSAAAPIEEPVTPEVASERRPISAGERRRMIELFAYHRAERIGFGATDPLEDWLVAEREVDAMLVHGVAL